MAVAQPYQHGSRETSDAQGLAIVAAELDIARRHVSTWHLAAHACDFGHLVQGVLLIGLEERHCLVHWSLLAVHAWSALIHGGQPLPMRRRAALLEPRENVRV